MRLSKRTLLALQLIAMAACNPPSPTEPSSPNPSATVVTSPSADPGAPGASGCAFWGGRGFSLKYSYQGGNAQWYRRFEYDDTSGSMKVDDSDTKFVVTKRAITLTQQQRDELARALSQVCPTDKELVGSCAPGGCVRLEVMTSAGKKTSVESWAGNETIASLLKKFFPELKP